MPTIYPRKTLKGPFWGPITVENMKQQIAPLSSILEHVLCNLGTSSQLCMNQGLVDYLGESGAKPKPYMMELG